MVLVRLRKDYKAELRADFRHYYGVSFDEMLTVSVIETADMAALLPRGSRTFTAINPEYSWEQSHYLLANIANSLQLLVWAQTKDGQKNRNRPKPIMPPKLHEDKPTAHTVDKYKDLLSRPRKEV